MPDIEVGDRARIYLGSEFWRSTGWFEGTVVRVDPFSTHRSFYWIELDLEVESAQGGRTRLISVLNPKHIVRLPHGSGS